MEIPATREGSSRFGGAVSKEERRRALYALLSVVQYFLLPKLRGSWLLTQRPIPGEIINDSHDISRIEARKLQIQDVPFGIEIVIKEVIDVLTPTAREKGLQKSAQDATSHRKI